MKVSWDDYPIYTVHIFSPPPPRPTSVILFSYYIDCFIARSTICILLSAKKTHNALESLLPFPHPKVDLPKLCFFFLCFGFPFLVPLSFPNPTQNKSSKAKNKPKKTLHWRAFSPSPSQSRSPNFLCFSFLGTTPLPKPNPKQVIQHVCMFILSGVGERCWAINLNIYTICIAIWVV